MKLDRAAVVQRSFRQKIDSMRFINSLIASEIDGLAMRVNLGMKFLSRIIPMNSKHAKLVVFASGTDVLAICVIGRASQIGPSIVCPVAIDVINDGRPVSCDIKIDKPMFQILPLVNLQAAVTGRMASATSTMSGPMFTAVRFPKEMPGIWAVLKKIVQSLKSDNRSSHDDLSDRLLWLEPARWWNTLQARLFYGEPLLLQTGVRA